MAYTLTGTIKTIGKVVTTERDGKTYRNQKMLVSVPDKYPQTIPVDLNQKLQDQIDQFKEGQEVTVHFNLNGTAYTNKTTKEPEAFLKLVAWKIEGGSMPIQEQPFQATSQHDESLPF